MRSIKMLKFNIFFLNQFLNYNLNHLKRFSMAENIKIYRNRNNRLGFAINEATITNLLVDQQSLKMLVEHINKQFLICSNKQAECLLQGCVDYDNKLITIFALMLLLPITKSLYFNYYQYLFIEYLIIFIASGIFFAKEFIRSDQMKRKYIESEDILEEQFAEIQTEFNLRFDYLRMEYKKKIDQEEQDYLQIKVIRKPKPLKQLEQKFRKRIQLRPLQQ